MGLEAQCAVTFDGQTSAGKALLETNEIIFRGDFRLKIALRSITGLDTRDGALVITWPGGTATFALGPKAAETWAGKILNPKGLFAKLGVGAGQRIVVIHIPDDAFVAELRQRGATVSARPVKDADAIFLGAETLPGSQACVSSSPTSSATVRSGR